MTDTGKQFVAATARIAMAEIGGEAVLLHLVSGQYFGLNDVGARVWQYIQEPRTLDEIVDEMRKHYGVSADVLTNDVQRFLGTLERAALVVTSDTISKAA